MEPGLQGATVGYLNRKIVHLYNFFIYLKTDVNLFTLCYNLIEKRSFRLVGRRASIT